MTDVVMQREAVWSWTGFFLIVATLLLTAVVPFTATAQATLTSSGAGATSQAACANEVTTGANVLLARVNSTEAQLLAERSPQFQASLEGHGYQFVSLGALASINANTCSAVALSKVSVNFNIDGLYITSGETTAPVSVTVFVDPLLTSVMSVYVSNSTVEGLDYFSGYEAQYYSSPNYLPLLYTQEYYYQPSITYNTYCYTYSTYNTALQCSFSLWSGLSNGYGGANFLVQSGTRVLIQCSSGGTCGSPQYQDWWQWLQGGSLKGSGGPYGGVVYPGDQITPQEMSNAYNGGSSTVYQANVIDWTHNWVGLSGNLNVGLTAYWAQSELEIPSQGSSALGVFSSLPLYNVLLCYSSSTCWFWGATSNIQITTDPMYNTCPPYVQNIGLSTVGSTGYTESYYTNCGT
jgi:hypothetical protein